MSIQISIIIPMRLTRDRVDILNRLHYFLPLSLKNIEFMIVDDGSNKPEADLLKTECRKLNIEYLQTGITPEAPFNIARAHNYGVQNALGKYVLFLDINLLIYPSFYQDLSHQIKILDLDKQFDSFLMIPSIDLTQKGFKAFEECDSLLKKDFIQDLPLKADATLMAQLNYATSYILVDKLYYLSIGGQNDSLIDDGIIMAEFISRLISLAPDFPRPENYTLIQDKYNLSDKYQGWQAQMQLYGHLLALKGVYLASYDVDKYNKIPVHCSDNIGLLKEYLTVDWPKTALQPILQQEYSMVLSTTPFCLHNKLNLILGNYTVVDILKYQHYNDLMQQFHDQGYTQIVLPNPYIHETIYQIYRYCRHHKIKFIVCDQGALPDSIFHDSKGFLNDSRSYRPSLWDTVLTRKEKNLVEVYLEHLSQTVINNDLHDLNHKASDLNLDKAKVKVVIFLQALSDVRLNLCQSDYNKYEEIERFAKCLIEISRDDIQIIYKNHPLESAPITIEGAICADHISDNDLITLSNVVLTVNSDIGLIAAALKKPVFVLGECWYHYKDINIVCDVRSAEEFYAKLGQFQPDQQKVARLIHYLRYKFYAFGKQKTVTRKNRKTAQIKKTVTEIDYSEIQTAKYKRIYFKKSGKLIPFQSVLFNIFDKKSLNIHESHYVNHNDIEALNDIDDTELNMLTNTPNLLTKIPFMKIKQMLQTHFSR